MADEILGTDLFGDPVLAQRDGVGRPAVVWCREKSNKVLLAFAGGRSMKEAAVAVGLSVPTLRKVYFSECAQRSIAAVRMEMTQLARLNDQAEAGNVAAEKELLKQLERIRVRALSDRIAGRQSGTDKPKQSPKGKKDAQKEAAANVGGKFAPRPAPDTLLN